VKISGTALVIVAPLAAIYGLLFGHPVIAITASVVAAIGLLLNVAGQDRDDGL